MRTLILLIFSIPLIAIGQNANTIVTDLDNDPSVNLTPISVVPSQTGNSSNLNEFVIDPYGSIFFIDTDGESIPLRQKDTIEGGYSRLRSLPSRTLSEQVYVKDWTYIGPDDSVYTTIGGVFSKSTNGTENGGTVIVLSDGTVMRRQWDQVYTVPDWWECGGYDIDGTNYVDKTTNGNGIYNDSDRIQAATTLAGIGGEVRYLGREYLIDIGIRPLASQTHKNGILKRKTSVIGITQSGSTASALIVDNVSAFRVGQQVVVLDTSAANAGYAEGENSIAGGLIRSILSISGNTLNLNGAMTNYPGDNMPVLVHTNLMGEQTADYKTIIFNKMVFDGNRNNDNQPFRFPQDWRYFYSLMLGSSTQYAYVNDCRFINSPAEALTGAGGFINNSTHHNTGGSFAHISSATNLAVGLHIKGLRGDSSNVMTNLLGGHSDALITFSQFPQFVRLEESDCRNGFEYVIGIGLGTIGEVTVINNHFENFNGIFNFSNTSDITANNFNFSGNTFVNCGDFQLQGRSIARGFPIENVKISNNSFTNSRLIFREVLKLKVDNNQFYSTTDYLASRITNINSFNCMIALVFCNQVDITNNRLEGNNFYDPECAVGIGFWLTDAATKTRVSSADTEYFYHSGINISNNKVASFKRGISPAITTFATLTNQVVEFLISYNEVKMLEDNSQGSYACGIVAPAGSIAQSNLIIQNSHIDGTSYPLVGYGIHDDGENQRQRLDGAWLITNTIIGNPSSTNSIYLGAHGNSSNNLYNTVCIGNIGHTAIKGSATALASSRQARNEILNSSVLPNQTARTKPITHTRLENTADY